MVSLVEVMALENATLLKDGYIRELQEEIAYLGNQVGSKDEHIRRLSLRVNQLEDTNQTLEQELSDARVQVQEAQMEAWNL